MRTFWKLTQVSVISAAAMALCAGSASADIGKCQSGLLKAGGKLHSAAKKNIEKALNTVRAKGASAKTADSAEKGLAKLFEAGIGKYKASVDGLFVTGEEVCTSDDLKQLGLLRSGFNAPGTNPQDYLVTALVLKEVDLAIQESQATVGDAQELLNSILDLTNCSGTSASTTNAQCTGAGTPAACCVEAEGGTCRPWLCSFRAVQNPDCRQHACELSSSSTGSLNAGGTLGIPIPISLVGDDNVLGICQAPAMLATVLPLNASSDIRVVSGQSTRAVETSIPGLANVCVSNIRSQGWCDCSASPPSGPTGITFCRDHITNDNTGTDDCGQAIDAAAAAEDCICSNGTPDCQATACAGLDCIDGAVSDGSRCHSGVVNGTLSETYSGASTTGDCMVLNTIAFTLLPVNGLCVAVSGPAAGSALGQCGSPCTTGAVPCAPDVTCTALATAFAGTGACFDARGADQTNCTRDDLVPPNAPTTVPFTTGTSTTMIMDLVAADGSCSGGSNAGVNCADNDDCESGNCAGAAMYDDTVLLGPGAGLSSCSKLDASTLTGLKLVGSFPALDGAQTGDAETTFTLDCR